MICKKCDSEIPDGMKFCPNCGANLSSNENSINDSLNEVKAKATETWNNISGESKKFITDYDSKNSKYLIDGEKIIIKGKWSIIPFYIMWGLIFIILFIITKPFIGQHLSFGILPLSELAVIAWPVVIIMCILSIVLFVFRREFVITNRKVYGRAGLIGTKQYIIPLEKINYIAVKYSIIGRLLKSAKVVVYPGTFYGISFNFLSNANEIRTELEKIIYQSNDYNNARYYMKKNGTIIIDEDSHLRKCENIKYV